MAVEKGSTYRQRTNEEFEEALEASHGIITVAATMLGMSRQNLYYKLKNHPELAQYRLSCLDKTLDLAEEKLIEKVKEGNLRAIMFVLTNLGGERGYGDVNIKLIGQTANINANVDFNKLSLEEKLNLENLVNRARIDDAGVVDM